MKRILPLLLLAAFVQDGGCGCAHAPMSARCRRLMDKPGPPLRGRPSHVCDCHERADGAFDIAACLDSPMEPPKVTERPKPRCVTACDVRADLGEGDCRALNAAMGEILVAYARHVPEFRPSSASCLALSGWTVKVMGWDKARDAGCPVGSWRSLKDGVCYLGLTHHDTSTVEVADANFAFNALAHEVGHVLEREYGTALPGAHCNWSGNGIKAAIFDATGDRDPTFEDCDLPLSISPPPSRGW